MLRASRHFSVHRSTTTAPLPVPASRVPTGNSAAFVILTPDELARRIASAVEPLQRDLQAAIQAGTSMQLLTPADVALECRVSPRTAQRWFRMCPLVVVRGRLKRISRADLPALTGHS